MNGNFDMSGMTNDLLRLTVSQPFVHLMAVQGEICAHMGEMAESWGRNRAQDAQAMQEAVRRLSGTSDVNEITAICGDWMKGAMDRASDDLSQFATHSQAVLSAGMTGARQIRDDALTGTRQVQNEAVAAGKAVAEKSAKAAQ